MEKIYTFSIIIPHKNIPELLKRCLDSIPLREDIEIIVVDDNSDPQKVDFKNFPGINRSNTTVIFDKSGKGAGRARNIGLEKAEGKWLIFADADDVFTDLFDDILSEVKNSTADEVFFKVESRDSLWNLNSTTKHINDAIINAMLNDCDLVRYQSDVPWGKILNNSFLTENSIRFQEVPCANDTRFSALCDYYAKKIDLIPLVGYCYIVRKDSLWHGYNLKSLETRFRVDMTIFRFFMKNNRVEVADKYKKRGLGFITLMSKHSKVNYLKNYILYGIYTHSFRVVFVDIPKRIMLFIFSHKKHN